MGRTFKDYFQCIGGLVGGSLYFGVAIPTATAYLGVMSPNYFSKKFLKVGLGSLAFLHRFGYKEQDKKKLIQDINKANDNRNKWELNPEKTLCLPVVFDIYQELLEIDKLFREYSKLSNLLTQNNLGLEKQVLETSTVKNRINKSINNICGRLNQFDKKSHVKNTVATSHFLEKIGIFSNQLLAELDETYKDNNKKLFLRYYDSSYPVNNNRIKDTDSEEVKSLKQFNEKVNELYFKLSSYNNVTKDQRPNLRRDDTRSATITKGHTISLFTSHLYDRYFYGNYIKDDAVSISGKKLNTEFTIEKTDEKTIEKTLYLKTNVLITKVYAKSPRKLLSDEFKDENNGLITKRNYAYLQEYGSAEQAGQYISEFVMTSPFENDGVITTCSSFGSNGELEKRVITTSNLITTENYVENKIDSKIEQILSDDKTIKTIIEYNGSGDETNRQEFIVGDVSYHEELPDFHKGD